MELLDSRRLTGASVISDRPGAVIDVAANQDQVAAAIDAWRVAAKEILTVLGWDDEQLAVRQCEGGASLCISAPIDALYAATEINEWAWNKAIAATTESAQDAVRRLANEISEEANPALLQLEKAALDHGEVFLYDDDFASVGLGTGCQTWPVRQLPQPSGIDWDKIHSMPVGVITGTNGKTTSVRLAAAVARAAGLHVGYSSTDWLAVDETVIDQGDYAGPGGARTTVRRADIQIAILESARGGLLRRGIGVPKTTAALITRIARDHIGDFGSRTIDELLDIKWTVTRSLGLKDKLVLNADDARLVQRATQSPAPVVFFSLDDKNPVIVKHIADGGDAWALHQGQLAYYENQHWQTLVAADAIPLTLGGAARYNIGNALGVAALCSSLGIQNDAIRSGLLQFAVKDNPGRGNLYTVDGVKVLVDFAHNPDAFRAIVELATNLEANRRLIAFGEAGDRTDQLIQDLATTALAMKPQRVITLEIEKYARGREPGEIGRILREQFLKEGAASDQLTHHQTELGALKDALDWAKPGDLVILLSLAETEKILEFLQPYSDS